MDKRKDILRCLPPTYESNLYFVHFIQYGNNDLCIAMYFEQLRWLLAIPCSKPIHLPPTHWAVPLHTPFYLLVKNSHLYG